MAAWHVAFENAECRPRLRAPRDVDAVRKCGGRAVRPARPAPRGVSDCHFAAQLNCFIQVFLFPIIFSSCFSKVTIGCIPTRTTAARTGCARCW